MYAMFVSGDECMYAKHKIQTNGNVSRQARGRDSEDPAGLLYSLLSPACSGVLHL